MELRFFEIYRSSEFLYLLAEGAFLSAGLTLAAGVFGFVFAFVLAVLRFKSVPLLGFVSAVYIDFIRNTPLIVQLFFIAFGLPLLFVCLAILVSCIARTFDKFFGLFCGNSSKWLCIYSKRPA